MWELPKSQLEASKMPMTKALDKRSDDVRSLGDNKMGDAQAQRAMSGPSHMAGPAKE